MSDNKTIVQMTDGREVSFPEGTKMIKTDHVNGEGFSIRFDFSNGETRTFAAKPSDDLYNQYAAFGASTKIRNVTAGVKEIDDMIVAVDDVIEQLSGGQWKAVREGAANNFAGAGIVVRAICEVTGKTPDFVKDFLKKKLESTEGLTRQALYGTFRDPESEVGKVILRLEAEKGRAAGLSTKDLVAEMRA